MRTVWRRAGVGLVAGVFASYPPAATLGNVSVAVGFAMLGGALLALVNRAHGKSRVPDGAFTVAALGVPCGGVVSVYALPILAGQRPQWTARGHARTLPRVVGLVVDWLSDRNLCAGRTLAGNTLART